MKKDYYVNGLKVSNEALARAFFGGTLFVCSIREDGTIYPLNHLWLDRSEANSLLSWMKQGALKSDMYQILDMETVDLTKLCLVCYVDEAKEKMMNAFQKAQNKQ